MLDKVGFVGDNAANIKITYVQYVRNNLQLRTNNDPVVMQKFDYCMSIWEKQYAQNAASLALICHAIDYASEKHLGQVRRNGAPFFIHPLSTAETLTAIGQVEDAKVIASAVLHHMLSDKLATPQELELQFGKEVRDILEEFDAEPMFNRASDEDRMIVIKRAPTLSLESQLLKMAGMLNHAQGLDKNRPEIVWERMLLNQMPNTNPYLFQAIQRELRDR